MASTPRISRAEITGLHAYLFRRFARELLGDVPEPAGVMWHNRTVLTTLTRLGAKTEKWDRLDPALKSFAHMAVAAQVGCSWCLDFGETPYDEIAEAVGKSPAAVRQIAHRARDHVAARRPRMPVSTAEQREAVERFLAAVRHGDLQGLLDVLAPDVVSVADGGGVAAAFRRPIEGAERVATLLIAAETPGFDLKPIWLNGSPAARIDVGGELDTAVSLSVENGRITRIYAIHNPHKLAGLDGVAGAHAGLSRGSPRRHGAAGPGQARPGRLSS